MVDLRTVKAGDKLLVRDDYKGVVGYVSPMSGFEGMVVTVKGMPRIYDDDLSLNNVSIEEDPGAWNWLQEMFDYPEEETEIGDLEDANITELLFGAEV